jgi:surfeit locus 1 family protein
MTALTVVLCALFASLGRWQWHRGFEKQALWSAFERGAEAPRPLGSSAPGELPRFTRIAIAGRYDMEHQFLLDNRTHDGRAGYEALTPFTLEDGRILLVDRGWLPFTGFRDRLPILRFDSTDTLSVTGRLDELPGRGLASGHAAPPRDATWPKLTSYPTREELGAALGRAIEKRIVLLDREAPFGYVREWRPPGLPPERHLFYAVQWWVLAAMLLGLYGFLNVRRISRE